MSEDLRLVLIVALSDGAGRGDARRGTKVTDDQTPQKGKEMKVEGGVGVCASACPRELRFFEGAAHGSPTHATTGASSRGSRRSKRRAETAVVSRRGPRRA